MEKIILFSLLFMSMMNLSVLKKYVEALAIVLTLKEKNIMMILFYISKQEHLVLQLLIKNGLRMQIITNASMLKVMLQYMII